MFIFLLALINCFCNINENQIPKDVINEETMHEINEDVEGNSNYKKAEFEFASEDENQFFKYESTTLPTSRISSFRIDFDRFSVAMSDYKVKCVNVASTTSDSELISILKSLTDTQSSCIDGFRSYAIYDGIVKLDSSKPKLGIILTSTSDFSFTARIYFRVTERILGTDEEKPMEDESLSLVPFTVNIANFRALGKSKILFYSYQRVLQMLHSESSTPYPETLFSGNILSVYTNPNMVRQKYHNANIMTLFVNPYSASLGETFKFQVKLFESNFLLDYYVSSNPEGRPLNSPLLINMTNCSQSYYVILNYNKEEGEKSLVIDQIYGKMTYLAVATQFTRETWDEMIETDLDLVDLNLRKYTLPENSRTHMDVYKLQCELPLMLNFYYIDESEDLHQKMNFGDVDIFTLKSYETVNVPFFSITMPRIIIEIYNPYEDPIVIIEAQSETVYTKNTIIETSPFTLSNGINVKERAGLSDTRIIIKVGYSSSSFTDYSEFLKYSREFDTYLFEFPSDKKYFYTYAEIITSGTNADDNVKYCFTTNIGSALKPSSENCYRVSSNNPYTLIAYNPFIMYKDYELDENMKYYITFKAVTDITTFDVRANVETYDTTIRNYEGINNKITIDNTGDYSSILTPPKNPDPAIFVQVQICDENKSVKTKVIKPLTKEIVVDEQIIASNTKNSYVSFKNDFIDTEFFVTGDPGTNVFVRMVGLPTIYIPSFNTNQQISFDMSTNTLTVDSPLTRVESVKYTVLVDREGIISQKGFTLCSFVDVKIESLALYTKSIIVNNRQASIQLNFAKAGINAGEKFEAIVYAEQQTRSQMAFLSYVFEGTVGDIDVETIHEINETYTLDTNYVYNTIQASSSDASYYFSYLPSKVLEVPIGAFSIEVDQSTSGSLTGVACTFVENDTDPMSMIEAVEAAIEEDKSFCIGSQSTVNSKRYNYIFKYEYEDGNIPKKMVIKVSNGNAINGPFSIYMKTDQGVIIENTDFSTSKEYGKDESSKKSVIPYIVDVHTLRGDNETNYVSKVLFYSKHLEMQMYYIPEDSNQPIKLFCGNIALVLTNPQLAVQKYHATTLVLISENLEGQEHASLGDTFRFHTKMFRSEDQIEFFVSQNPDGRTLNFPLSLEMNTCPDNNNRLYYILNYNKPESSRTLHLDMIFGKYLRARIAREINAEKWDSLIQNSMTEITNYQAELPEKSQHIDVIEIQCKSPLLINAYYSYDTFPYNNVKEGEIVVKELPSQDSFSFTISKGSSDLFFYSMSLFNPTETPSVTVQFSDGTNHYITENSLQTGMLMSIPSRATIVNNNKSKTRFIFKIGYGVENNPDWHIVEEDQNLEGTLYENINKYVYKFPVESNEKNFTKISFLVNSINDVENVKFCYSTNLGIPIETSRENCFRTGKYIPYTLTFINPLIVGKDYKVDTDKYYISFRPFDDNDFINIEVTEQKYSDRSRNEEGVAKLLTLLNEKAGTILSLPKKEASKILVQLKSCKSHTNPISYTNYNALEEKELNSGKIYQTDKFGIYYITTNTYLENGIQLTGESLVPIFSKHSGINENYSPIIQDYKVTFDSSTNVASIIKPIYNEEFLITVIVSEKNTLNELTQCNLAFEDKSTFGKYSNTFTSVSSNLISHFINFNTITGFSEGTEFDLLVYAEQINNSKMEFIYPLITGKVGKVEGVLQINEFKGNEYVYKNFSLLSSSNYLFYNFARKPTGNVASLRIDSNKAKITKVGCAFVSPTATDNEMVAAVNEAVLEGTNACIGEMQSENGYDALINANYKEEKNRLVIQVLYGLGEGEKNLEEDDDLVHLYLKISGTPLGTSEGKYGQREEYAPIPYVIDLLQIRNSKIGVDYVSKVLFYSNTREMQMFYIDTNENAPVSLFTGNIMLVYTNEELVKQKYHGATTMILLTDALSATNSFIIGEQYRFMVKYFNSAANIQYFLSSNPDGRPLNNPTAIEMTSCEQPYYYILNYNKVEGQRKLHIDTIFGERASIRIANSLNNDNWDSLVSGMKEVNGEEMVLQEQTKYHFDVIEVKCNLPLLLNLFYVDPENPKLTGLQTGDITIFSLEKGQQQQLLLQRTGLTDRVFVYSFNILREMGNPNIEISFNGNTPIQLSENGVYPQYGPEYERILIQNKDNSGAISTRIIFKFGDPIEQTFERNSNGVYSNKNDETRTMNLYGYIHDQTKTKLNYTGVDFRVETDLDNVKFCYSTNLGTYIIPSLQNCYRVGKNNPYTISTLNPLVMYRNYYSQEGLNYYVGFRTVELEQNINIVPIPKKYDTTERNVEGENNKITISYEKSYSTILTAPKNNEPFIFVQLFVCKEKEPLTYKFLNAYNGTNLGYDGEIPANSKEVHYQSITNTKLDTELKLFGNDGVPVFVKHVGISEKYQPTSILDIEINFDNKTRLLNWSQPIIDERFIYTIYIDKNGTLQKLGYTLCDIAEVTKLAHYSKQIETDSRTPNFTVPSLGDEYNLFAVIILAEQVNKGKLTILSPVYDSSGNSYIPPSPNDNDGDGGSSNNTNLIILIIILSVIIIAGAIFAFVIYRKYKSKGVVDKNKKETSMALIKSTKNDKLVESQAQETNQIDP